MKGIATRLWRWIAGTSVAALIFVIGFFCARNTSQPKTPDTPSRMGLLPNPAYQAKKQGSTIELVTNPGTRGERRYGMDEASLALWNVLVESLPKNSSSPPIGLTTSEVIAKMQELYPDRPGEVVAEQVRSFLRQALSEGLVLTDHTQVQFKHPGAPYFIDYEPAIKGSAQQ